MNIVYFYYRNNEIIYIGKTTDLITRHRTHMKELNFIKNPYTHIGIIECLSKIDMDIYEKYYIAYYKPKLNVTDTQRGEPTALINVQSPKIYSKDDFENNYLPLLNPVYKKREYNKYDFILKNKQLNEIKKYKQKEKKEKTEEFFEEEIKINEIFKEEIKININAELLLEYNLNYNDFRFLLWIIYIFEENNSTNDFYPNISLYAKDIAKYNKTGTIYKIIQDTINNLIKNKILNEQSNAKRILFDEIFLKKFFSTSLQEFNYTKLYSKQGKESKYCVKFYLLILKYQSKNFYIPLEELRAKLLGEEYINKFNRTSEFQRCVLYPVIDSFNKKFSLKVTLQKVLQITKISGYSININNIVE